MHIHHSCMAILRKKLGRFSALRLFCILFICLATLPAQAGEVANPSGGTLLDGDGGKPLFCQVSEDGFGNCYNRYVWGMIADDDYLYVGTLNVVFGVPPIESPEDFLLLGRAYRDEPLQLSEGCEIWRYDGERWECMMTGGFGDITNMGIRNFIFYRGELYAGTMNWGSGAGLWKSADQGVTWEPVSLQGFGNPNNESVRGMCVWNNKLWFGTTNITDGAELYWYNHNWMKLVADRGIDNPKNVGIGRICEYRNNIVMGTWNILGCEVYAYDGIGFEKLVGTGTNIRGGFGHYTNWAVLSMEVFRNRLYVGLANFFLGFSLHRTRDCYDWEQIGDLGFGHPMSKYAWDLEVYQDKLFLGTFDLGLQPFLAEGCQLYASSDGYQWEHWMGEDAPVTAGFDDQLNYGIRNLEVFDGDLYAGTAQCFFCLLPRTGCEVWRYPVRSDDGASMD